MELENYSGKMLQFPGAWIIHRGHYGAVTGFEAANLTESNAEGWERGRDKKPTLISPCRDMVSLKPRLHKDLFVCLF